MASVTLSMNNFAHPLSTPPVKRNRNRKEKEAEGHIVKFLITIFLILSGVCIMTICLSHPILAFDGDISTLSDIKVPIYEETNETQKIISEADIKAWENKIIEKYKGKPVYFKTTGVAHIRTTKYINNMPIKINIVEINPNINPDLVIKPDTANQNLNARAKIKNIASRNNALVAVNGGYFKPQTGVPLGSLMIDGVTLTGPIYNRVALGITQSDAGTSFSMGRVELDIKLKNKIAEIKVDNINQPRMLSTYTLLYTDKWGKISPAPPKYGANALIQEGKITKISASPIEIPSGAYVVSAPYSKIDELQKLKNLSLEINYPEQFKGSDHIIGAGPFLLKDGKIYIDTAEEKLLSVGGKNPRSAIGYTEDNSLIIVTVDGREKTSVGMTLNQLASLMKSLGCANAMNFDGGSSTVMYIAGNVVNSPVNSGGVPISNALIVSEKKNQSI
ncbi:phosphodiester glycosidase family protein [bacterium]|nr:phosphodiester glycosidase family protein [bacterium]